MGGDIEVKSKVDVGTTFTFDIRVQSIESAQITPQTKKVVTGIDQSELTLIPKILIVDDVKENCLLLESILKPIGFVTRTAYNGDESIELWQNWQPDLIFMDIQMPVMDGYQAVEFIRQQEIELLEQLRIKQPVTIVAVTASIFDDQADNICEFGFDDLIRKPFTENIILERLEKHLDIKYIYDLQPQETTNDLNTSINLTELLEQDILVIEGQKMSLAWREQVMQSANKGSDDELFDLIAQIPEDFVALPEMLSHLTHEFLFEEISRLLSKIKASSDE